MARFHINPETGQAGPCRSTQGKCPFGGASDHFDTLQEATVAAEKRMAEQEGTVPSVARKPAKPDYDTQVPEPVYEFVAQQVNAEDLEPGDKLTSGVEVLSKNIGRKYAAITVTDEKKGARTVHIPLGEDTAALKRTETQESKQVREAAMRERNYEMFVKQYKPKRDSAAQDIQDRVSKGYRLDGYHLDRLVEAEAKDTIMARYKHMVEQVKTHEPQEANPYSRAFAVYKEELEQEVLSSSSRGNSVSTSEAQNFFERGLVSAKAEFVRHGVRAMY